MSPFLSHWLDRTAIQMAAARMPQPDGRDLHVDEARSLLATHNFTSADPTPAAVEFDGPIHFHFVSPHPSGHAANDVVPGRLYRCDDGWQKKPVVLLLHGWNDALDHHFFFPRHARRLNKMGLSAATLQMPYQFDRYPRELGAWGNFLGPDLRHTVHATFQAMTEIRAFVNWLGQQGCPFIGLWGVSLGAWLTGMSIRHDPRISAAVLTVPVARVDRLFKEVAFCAAIRDVLQQHPINLARLNLAANVPVIPRQNILLIEGEDDLFVPKETIEELWRAWNEPEIWRYPRGHISILATPGLSARVAQWFTAKVRGSAGK